MKTNGREARASQVPILSDLVTSGQTKYVIDGSNRKLKWMRPLIEVEYLRRLSWSTYKIYLRNIHTTICPKEFTQVSANGNKSKEQELNMMLLKVSKQHMWRENSERKL